MISFFSDTKKKIAIFLIVIILSGSSSLFVAPRSVHAQMTVTDFVNLVVNALDWVANFSADISISDTALSTNAIWVKDYVLDPLAWVVSQKSLQSMTGSIVNFVNGKGNGGNKQFVQDFQGHMQTLGDSVSGIIPGSKGFLATFSTNLKSSPFASSIASSLRDSYLQNTSLGGFFSANKSTLSNFSTNANKFLAGNWSQGGVSAWFALTTQDNNNPYALYRNAQGQLNSLVASAQAARSSQISSSGGFLSWCNVSTTFSSIAGIKQDPCTNKDGSAGIVQTPGSVIQGQLTTIFGSGINKLVSADELSEVLGNIALGFVVDILGGSSGGLAGVSEPGSGGGRSLLNSLTNENPTKPTDPTTIIHQKLAKVETYKKNWDYINAAALNASEKVKKFQDHCSSEADKAKKLITEGGIIGINLNEFISTANRLAGEANDILSSDGAIYNVLFQASKRNKLVIDVMTLIGKIQYEAGSTSATDSITSISTEKPKLTDYTTALASVVKTDYSKASWDAYWDIVIDKEETTKPTKTVVTTGNNQEEVDFATNAIKEAQEDLIRSGKTDISKYTKALGLVKEEDYTAESWSAYQKVVRANVVTADNLQREIDIAVARIIDAQIDLIPKEGVTASTANSNNIESLRKQLAADLTTLQEMPPTSQDVAKSEAKTKSNKNVAALITAEENSLVISSNDSESIIDLMIMYLSLTEEGYEWEGNLWGFCSLDAFISENQPNQTTQNQ